MTTSLLLLCLGLVGATLGTSSLSSSGMLSIIGEAWASSPSSDVSTTATYGHDLDGFITISGTRAQLRSPKLHVEVSLVEEITASSSGSNIGTPAAGGSAEDVADDEDASDQQQQQQQRHRTMILRSARVSSLGYFLFTNVTSSSGSTYRLKVEVRHTGGIPILINEATSVLETEIVWPSGPAGTSSSSSSSSSSTPQPPPRQVLRAPPLTVALARPTPPTTTRGTASTSNVPPSLSQVLFASSSHEEDYGSLRSIPGAHVSTAVIESGSPLGLVASVAIIAVLLIFVRPPALSGLKYLFSGKLLSGAAAGRSERPKMSLMAS